MNPPIRALAALAALACVTAPASAAQRARQAPQQAAPAPAAAELTNEEVVRRVNAFLNGVDSLSTEFAQTNADGRRVTGRFYLRRPGRLRFDYDPPSALEIVADGTHVVVRDRKLNTQDIFPVGQTPLSFLLMPDIDISRDLKLTGVSRSAHGTYVSFESSSTFVGTSRVALFFDDSVTQLLQWRVLDAQGRQTAVTLNVLDRTPIQDARVFDIKFQSQR